MADLINPLPANPGSSVPPGAVPAPLGRFVFLLALFAAGAGLVGWMMIRHTREPASAPDLAQEAREYVRKQKETPLSGSLQQLLTNVNGLLVPSQDHALLAQRAPAFELSDHEGKVHGLKEYLAAGPVLLVFYYGYHCSHCVSQLFDIDEKLPYFRELGAQVVAISADAPDLTHERFKKYGPFGFPVLSDPGNKIAAVYGVAAIKDGKQDLLHGTFVIDRDGIVQWVNVADTPFSGARTLLYQLAKVEGRLPAKPGS